MITILHYCTICYKQLDDGFKPKWLISLHYQHPTEYAKPFKETNKPLGFGDRINFKTKRNIWYEDALYKYWDAKRKDEMQVAKDVKALKTEYCVTSIKLNDLIDTTNTISPTFISLMKRKTKQKYHTHIVLPDTLCYNNQEELYDVFNTTIRNRLTSISTWKSIDVSAINSMYDIFGYLNKETKSTLLLLTL